MNVINKQLNVRIDKKLINFVKSKTVGQNQYIIRLIEQDRYSQDKLDCLLENIKNELLKIGSTMSPTKYLNMVILHGYEQIEMLREH